MSAATRLGPRSGWGRTGGSAVNALLVGVGQKKRNAYRALRARYPKFCNSGYGALNFGHGAGLEARPLVCAARCVASWHGEPTRTASRAAAGCRWPRSPSRLSFSLFPTMSPPLSHLSPRATTHALVCCAWFTLPFSFCSRRLSCTGAGSCLRSEWISITPCSRPPAWQHTC